MKKTLIKLLSLLIVIRYGLFAKQSWTDSEDETRMRQKFLAIYRACKFFGFVDN